MVRGRCAEALASWLDAVTGGGIVEFESFAAALRPDHEAVVAALSCEWSNGQTEGQIKRADPPAQDDQMADVRAGELRPPAGACASSRAGITGASGTETT